MDTSNQQTIPRDPALFYWVLIPITVVMIITGILRHYATVLLQSPPKKQSAAKIREHRSLIRGASLRNNSYALSPTAFRLRKDDFAAKAEKGSYLADPDNAGQPPPNPMTDPAMMEGMMGMMKGNITMMVSQTLIMGWINAFFSGFVIMKLPFPLTPQFKSMLQSGVGTRDLDVRWVSSISWYFLLLFGLQPVYNFILGSDNSANQQMAQQMAMNPGAMMQPNQDQHKAFIAEAENLEVLEHKYILDGVEERILKKFA